MPDLSRILKAVLGQEIAQLKEEGRDLGQVVDDVEACEADDLTRERLEELYARLEDAPEANGYPYVEPSELESLRLERPPGPRELPLSLSAEDLYDRVYGAWLGRCAGCTLGKPVEGWPKERVERYLKAASAYPLSNYFTLMDPFPEGLSLHDNRRETT